MTAYPPHDPRLQYQFPGAPYANTRPGSVTALGVIGLVLASIIILNHAAGLAMRATGSGVAPGDPGSLASVWPIVDSVISLAFAILLFAASIGLLRFRPWGRRLARLHAIAYLPWVAICLVIGLGWTIPATVRQLQASGAGTQAYQSGAVVGMYAGAVLILGIACIYPIFVLATLNKPRIVAAFGETLAGEIPYATPGLAQPPMADVGAHAYQGPPAHAPSAPPPPPPPPQQQRW